MHPLRNKDASLLLLALFFSVFRCGGPFLEMPFVLLGCCRGELSLEDYGVSQLFDCLSCFNSLVFGRVCVYVEICTYVHMNEQIHDMCIYICIHMYTCIYTYTHTYKYTYIYIYMCNGNQGFTTA